MAKILHTSGFQLGKRFSGIGKAGDIVRSTLKESLEDSVKIALEQRVDLFLVVGDLFSTNFVSAKLIDFVCQQVERLGRIPFVVVPGEGDPLDDHSIYRNISSDIRPENFHVFIDPTNLSFHFPDSEITVHGVPFRGHHIALQSGSQQLAGAPGTIQIVAIGGGLADGENGQIKQLIAHYEQSGSDYIAVGGGHSFQKLSARAYSSGTAERLGFTADNGGEIAMIEFNGSGFSVEQISTGTLEWKSLELDNSQYRFNLELERELQKYVSDKSLVKVRLNGEFSLDGFLDLLTLEQEQRDRFCFLEIEDTRLLPKFTSLSPAGSAGSLVGEFSALLNDAIEKAPPELKPLYQKVLCSGRAMLSGKDFI